MPPSLLPVPHHRQSHDHTCVPACVRMVLEYLGLPQTEDELARLLGTTEIGTRARHTQAVSELGFAVRFGTGSFAELQAALARQEAPVIYLWTGALEHRAKNGPHAVVAVGAGDGEVHINDPFFDIAPHRVSRQAFLTAWATIDYLWTIITRLVKPAGQAPA